MQVDEPPFLPVGTDVSAKYKGAFCEAKIKKVSRSIKCKVTLKAGGNITVNDEVIKGTLRVGSTVEVKQDPKKDAVEAIITKIQDCSQYTVVFDDGDITTLRRSALCLKSGRHFNESETLDQLPLTHPEHFSTPVIAGRRGRRGRAASDESEGEVSTRRMAADSEPHVGRVVLVEAAGGAERRRPHQPAFPALVVAPTPAIKVKEDYLVRSFKDGRYYTVPKKEAREFRKGSAPIEWGGVEAALQFLNNGTLPPHWDRAALFNEPRNTSDDSSDDEPREEKDHFVAQLYKFMDDRGTPLNRNPTIANRDIDLYRLFRVVQKLGGYNRVTNQNQWKTIADKMGFHPVTTSITNLCKQAYKKFLHSFEDFYRKLGVTLVAHPRGARTPPAGRSLIRDRDKQPPTSSSACSTPTNTQRTKDKDSDKSETDKSEKEEKLEKADKPKEKVRGSDEEDSADNQPLITTAPKVEKEKEKDKEKEKEKEKDKDNKSTTSTTTTTTTTTTTEEKIVVKPRSQSRNRALPVKTEVLEKRTPKRRPISSKESTSAVTPRASRRPHASTDSDSSGRASRCGPTKKMQSRRSQSANSASSGNTIASNSSKRPRKRKTTEPSTTEPSRAGNVKAQVGDKLKVYYGPTQSESKVTYEAKVIEISSEGMLRVHYTGWNTRYDEWIKPQRIALNVTQHEIRNKKSISNSRRVRSKRTEESSARSDSDSDSDSDDNVKRPPKKPDDKSNIKTPRSKDAKSSDSSSSSKPRKRPIRTVSTPTTVSPAKKPRPSSSTHQGRDYDLNEIRSELKGLHTVKQETEEPIKQEVVEKEASSPPQAAVSAPEPAPQEKQPKDEDVYEFKEPEPFELELHDEKKKRTHRIFDDISPSKYTSTLSKSLSEEISEDPLKSRTTPLRSPSLSPFRDFGSSSNAPGRQSPEEDSKDGLFSLDEDSFPGDGSSGHRFEGFIPAKNQETYSKKSKVTKLRELIDDSPDSRADDEQSSEDEPEDIAIKEELGEPSSSSVPASDSPKSPEPVKETTIESEQVEESKTENNILSMLGNPEKELELLESIPEPANTPPPLVFPLIQMKDIPIPSTPSESTRDSTPDMKEETVKEETSMIDLDSIPLPSDEPKDNMFKINKEPKEAILKTKETKEKEPFKNKESKESTTKVKEIKEAEDKEPSETVQKSKDTKDSIFKPKDTKETPVKAKDPKDSAFKSKDPKESTPKPKDPKESVPKPKDTKETIFKPKDKDPKESVFKPKDTPESVFKPKENIIKVNKELKESIFKINRDPKDSCSKAKDPVESTLKPKEAKEVLKIKIEPLKILDPEPNPPKLEPPSSPLIDTEEDKSEPDSPARIDVIPEPPPAFLVQSEGPKIADKLLKAINSAKRLSMSPPPVEDKIDKVDKPRALTPKTDLLKTNKPEGKQSPIPLETKTPKQDTKPLTKEPLKKISPTNVTDSIFGEPSNFTDAKRDLADIKKVKAKEPSPPRLLSPLNILERRKSVADLPMPTPGKNNKVLSDTIQKLSSQINSSQAAAASIPLPPFPAEDRSESSDSDDSDRRLIIDKLTVEEWSGTDAARSALHAGKSPGEWSAGETLLMLEDACKNERKHSARVVVAGSARGPAEDDSNLSLLLCEETIPGSPAPDAEPPPRADLHMPFACAPQHAHKPEERRAGSARSPVAGGHAAEAGMAPVAWGRRALLDNTPPTTPDSSLDMSPMRERRISERDSPMERKEDEDDRREIDASAMDIDKSLGAGARSRKASESSCAGRGRSRRARRDTDDARAADHHADLKYNFFIELDPSWDCQTRINVLTTRLADLRKAYHSVKAELAAIDRRRKKLRRKEREAVKAAKAACS
ncbi:AT-rich interactive domain-containing protein 4B-like [Cydia pomonella]|uniref:AT-rich interactive domain-containing protein 4B-like n=1 Tax=Cydia pomonella TaxID=82600 RepID=UPI002ADD3627|nr:AT-rich interactive domain-containing protein 4B-like [Cydia pomonella]